MGPSSNALELVRELAADRDGAERRFNLGLGLARSAGTPISDLAHAAGLSTSRVNALLERQGKPIDPPQPLDADQVAEVLDNAFTVGIVPAGRLALIDYERFQAYICQPRRSFRHEMDWLGFYAHAQISPHFPWIRNVWNSVPFNSDEVGRRRATHNPLDAELADLIEEVLALPRLGGHRAGEHKVFLLSPPEDPKTITLKQPIRHLERGRGRAFVRKQRYTTPAALRREPKTTAELLKFERG